MSTIFVIEAAKKLMAKYEYEPELIEKGAVLPVLSNQKMNAYLKEIADLCEIQKNLERFKWNYIPKDITYKILQIIPSFWYIIVFLSFCF